MCSSPDNCMCLVNITVRFKTIFLADSNEFACILIYLFNLYFNVSVSARSNRLRLLHSCSRNVLIELGRSFCGSFYCSYLWTHYNKASFSKICVTYNDLYRKILHVSRRSSASAMFVNSNIPTFECLIRRDIFSFTSRLKVSTNLLINAIENCWLLKHVI